MPGNGSGPVVSCRTLVPSALITKISYFDLSNGPLRANAIIVPSGDQAGSVSPAWLVNW